jgi:hypothetical protein
MILADGLTELTTATPVYNILAGLALIIGAIGTVRSARNRDRGDEFDEMRNRVDDLEDENDELRDDVVALKRHAYASQLAVAGGKPPPPIPELRSEAPREPRGRGHRSDADRRSRAVHRRRRVY